MKPKNFTELIQSNDYCENECEVGQDGIMSEAQHEACLGKVLNLNIEIPNVIRLIQDIPIDQRIKN